MSYTEDASPTAVPLGPRQLKVVVFLLVCLDFGGAFHQLFNKFFKLLPGEPSIGFAIILFVLGVGLLRHTAWARVMTVFQLWLGVLAVFGSLAPRPDNVETYPESLLSIIAIVVLLLALLLYSLHVLGKFKNHFYKKII